MNSAILVGRNIGMDNKHVNAHFGMMIILKKWRRILPNNWNNGHGIHLSRSQ